jgi:hypothetical protein
VRRGSSRRAEADVELADDAEWFDRVQAAQQPRASSSESDVNFFPIGSRYCR